MIQNLQVFFLEYMECLVYNLNCRGFFARTNKRSHAASMAIWRNSVTKQGKRQVRTIGTLLFITYILSLSYFLFFSERFGRTDFGSEYRYNLIFFQEIKRYILHLHSFTPEQFILNILGNVFAFTPFGFCMPLIKPKYDRLIRIFICSMLFSLMIESIQLVFKVGSFDVDDILLNTSGALLGFLVFRVCLGYHKKRERLLRVNINGGHICGKKQSKI